MLVGHVSAVMLMADDTAEDGKIVGIGVAVAALIPLVGVPAGVDREIETVMVELRIPVIRGVALSALVRKSGGGMIRIVCAVVIRLMTEIAVGGRTGILPVDMALNAVHGDVRAG